MQNKDLLIFDIGANKGHFTDACLAAYNNAAVITIEPNPALYRFLQQKYSNSSLVEVLPNVVSSKAGVIVDFFLGDVDTISTAEIDWMTNSRFSSNTWSEPLKIETVSLDSLISKYGTPTLIKIDVEGYELEVVKGLSTKQGPICFEWAEEQYSKINQTCAHLESLGYSEFGYTYGDAYLQSPIVYTTWKDCDIHQDMDPNRKEKWGMIWAK